MSLYLDTSLLVSSISSEVAAARVQEWMRDVEDDFVLSDWSLAEFVSALRAKERAGTVSHEQARDGLLWFEDFAANVVGLHAVSRSAFRRAAELAGRMTPKVRAADALHLAVAEAHQATICTLDADQAAAGEAAGIRVLMV